MRFVLPGAPSPASPTSRPTAITISHGEGGLWEVSLGVAHEGSGGPSRSSSGVQSENPHPISRFDPHPTREVRRAGTGHPVAATRRRHDQPADALEGTAHRDRKSVV